MPAVQIPGDRYPATLADCKINLVPDKDNANLWHVSEEYTHARGLSVEYHPKRNVFTINRHMIPVAVCTGPVMAHDCLAVKLGMR